MTQTEINRSQNRAAGEALELLAAAWAYYRPIPQPATEVTGRPSPVIQEYYAV